MKIKTLIIVTMFATLFGLAQTTMASISNHFRTTDGDSDIINYNMPVGSGLTPGCYFGIYDYNGSPSSGLDLLKGSSLDLPINVEVTKVGQGLSTLTLFESAEFEVRLNPSNSHYYINVITGVDESKSLDIGLSDDFSFYFKNGSNYDTGFTIISGGGDAYSFVSDKGECHGNNIIGDDLSAVTIPDSSILLLSGLLGLVGLGNRRKIM